MYFILIEAVVFLEIGLDDVIGLLVDNLSAVNNLLAFLYESTSERDTGDEFVTAGLAACTIVDKVRLDIVVQVAFLQQMAVNA